MPTDWIKIRTDIYRDPKVSIIAFELARDDSDLARYVNQMCQCNMAVTRNVMRNVTVGALVSVWGVARHQGKRVGDDLLMSKASIDVIDDLADLPGFGAAMLAAGWLEQTDDGVVLPRFFEENNVEASKSKSNAERQKRWRDRNKTVTENVTLRNAPRNAHCYDREEREKSKRDSNKKRGRGGAASSFDPLKADLIPESLRTPEFSKAWFCYCQHRKEIKKRLTPTATQQAIAKLAAMGVDRAVAALDHTVANGWQGIREPDSPAAKSVEQVLAERPILTREEKLERWRQSRAQQQAAKSNGSHTSSGNATP